MGYLNCCIALAWEVLKEVDPIHAVGEGEEESEEEEGAAER
jgi:hypothetical protein